MTDATDTLAPEEEVPEELKQIGKTTKRGFDLSARLKNRGLRKSSIVLFLDEEKGVELGWAYENTDQFGNKVGTWTREGVIGRLDTLVAIRATAEADYDARDALLAASGEPLAKDNALKKLDKEIAELTKQRDEMIAELTKTGITIKLRAVPPIIQKDMRRRAKETLEITAKNIPDDVMDEFNLALSAHLMTVLFQSITDNETGEVNTEITYQDAIDLIGYLPPGQFQRLDNEMGKVQFMDAISTQIETQEDFS